MEKSTNTKFHDNVHSLIEYKVKKEAQKIQQQQALDEYIRTLTCTQCDGHDFMLVADSKDVVCSTCQMKVQVEYTANSITEEEE
jgi:hypothetical protein